MKCSEMISSCCKDCVQSCKKSADICYDVNDKKVGDQFMKCMRSCEMIVNLHDKNNVNVCDHKDLIQFCKKQCGQCKKHAKDCAMKMKKMDSPDSKKNAMEKCHLNCSECVKEMSKVLQKK